MSEMTAYEAIGGKDVIRGTIDLFYENLLGDIETVPPVSRHFENLSTSRLETVRERTGTVVGRLLGAPGEPPVDMVRLARVHARLDITLQDFDVTIGHLVRAFQILPEGEVAVAALGQYVEPLRGMLVTMPQGRTL